MSALDSLYQQIILEESKTRRGGDLRDDQLDGQHLPANVGQCHQLNPVCGDGPPRHDVFKHPSLCPNTGLRTTGTFGSGMLTLVGLPGVLDKGWGTRLKIRDGAENPCIEHVRNRLLSVDLPLSG